MTAATTAAATTIAACARFFDRFTCRRTSGSRLALAMLLAGASCAAEPPPPPASAAAPARVFSAPAAATAAEPPAPIASPAPPLALAETTLPAGPACEARQGADGLRRAAVLRTLDGGLGNWLRTVDVDAKLEHGRFRGWIIRTLPEGDACYSDLDLHAGDVVTRINGRAVERPEEASQVWDGLRTSSALVIDFVRAGQPRTLRFKIVEP